MKVKPSDIALALIGAPFETLDDKTQRVAQHIAEHKHIAKDMSHEQTASSTVGQRAADAVASFGGSWTFIGLFGATLVGWIGLNSFFLGHYGRVFDSYPYILLNLVLSMLAAIQAPIILMSQNRQAQKDRLIAEHDYEVNLKAELKSCCCTRRSTACGRTSGLHCWRFNKSRLAFWKSCFSRKYHNENRGIQCTALRQDHA